MAVPVRSFGAALAHERARQCRSMAALAQAAGMHASEISRLEHNQRDPRLSTIVRLARALDVPVRDLLQDIG